MVEQPSKTGTLYVVATPIGNLEDVSERAIRTLSEVDLIAAEDTRISRILTNRYGVRTPLVAYHQHNETRRAPVLVDRLVRGENIAVISDAGTPLISDAGYLLVRMAQERGITVTAVPGPCAAVAALSIAGLPTDRFAFEGFLPARAASRRRRLRTLREEPRTLIFYESVHRIVATLRDMVEILGEDREAAVSRELTKKFETIRRDTLKNLAHWIAADPDQQKGEFVVLVRGCAQAGADLQEAERVLKILIKTVPVKQAVALAAEITGSNKNRLYRLALRIRGP